MTSHPNRWIAPFNEFAKVNFDTALFDDQDCLGVSVVIRDLRDDFLTEFSK